MNDRQTIRLIRLGDIQAFEGLFRKYYEDLSRWAYRYLHDMDHAEEEVQNLFYHLWRDRETLNIKISIKSYLYRAVSNNCMMLLKKHNRRQEIVAEMKENRVVEQPVDLLEEKEIKEAVDRTLDQLPEQTAAIFRMSRYEGLKYREIAQKLSISVKTVEANMTRAIKLFRKNLSEYMES